MIAEQYSTAQCIHNPAGAEMNFYMINMVFVVTRKSVIAYCQALRAAFGFSGDW